MSTQSPNASISGSCRPMAMAAISAPPPARARSISTICARSRRRPINSVISGCCCRRDEAVRISWVVASAVAPWTERLRYLVAVRPGLQSPSVAARMTATLDRVSNGRLLVNVVTGGDPVENKGDGVFLDHDERYAVTREFLNVYSDLLAGKTVNVEGKHIRIEDGRLLFPPVQSPRPAAVFRRIVGRRHRCRRRYRRQIPDLGRTAGAGRREGQPGEGRRSEAWTQAIVRYSFACDRA